MAKVSQHPDLSDPFSDLSVPVVAFFPQTLGAASSGAGVAASEEVQGLNLIQNLFKSTVPKSSKLLDQVQVIRKSYSGIQNMYSEAKDNDTMANDKNAKDHPVGRRPALGRKRAQFSLMPTSRDSLPEVDFSSSTQIKDPTEYYKALEQLEIAENELKKLRGEAVTELIHHQSTTARQRRAGILGRTTHYKYQDQTNPDMIEATTDSQVVSSRQILSPINTASGTGLPNVVPPEEIKKSDISHAFKVDAKLSGPIGKGSDAHKQKPIWNMLEELFSSFKAMDGGNGVAMLQDISQIGSNESSKLTLSGLDSTQSNELRSLDIGMKTKFDGSQLLPRSVTRERNILAVEAALRKRISLKYQPGDPDSRPATNDAGDSGDSPLSVLGKKQHMPSSSDTSCPITRGSMANAASTPVNINENFLGFTGEMHSSVHEEQRSIDNDVASEESTKHVPCSLENVSNQDYNSSKEKANYTQYGTLLTQPDFSVKYLTSCLGNGNNIENMAGPSNTTVDESSNPSNVPGTCGGDATLEGKMDTMVENEPVPNAELPKDVSSLSVAILPVDAPYEDLCILHEETNKGIQTSSGITAQRGRKRKVCRSGQKKQIPVSQKQKDASKRHSLAGAGLSWKSDVRRSTRVKSKPLQYWRGERFLYGRVHNSLATAIGVIRAKYPDAGVEDPEMAVESLAGEYEDPVDKQRCIDLLRLSHSCTMIL